MGNRSRVAALDWMRGLVMALMAVDHAGAVFNAGHLTADSAAMYQAGTPLPLDHFLTRWMTHLCAPTFLFLAGAALALSAARRRERGVPEGSLDLHMILRGAFILALDPTLVTISWRVLYPLPAILQVLYAIGGAMIAMALLRRLPSWLLVVLAVAILAGGEAITRPFWSGQGFESPVPVGLLLAIGSYGSWFVVYPLLPWLAMMLLGWALGSRMARGRAGAGTERTLVFWGVAGLIVFTVVRWANGYGNMWLHREDHSLAQWLHVSKYPPALAFSGLMLGLMALFLAALLRYDRARGGRFWRNNPLFVFGQTPMLFYILHIPALTVAGWLTGLSGTAGLPLTYAAGLAVMAVLYPICRGYRSYKQAHPDGWTRFV